MSCISSLEPGVLEGDGHVGAPLVEQRPGGRPKRAALPVGARGAADGGHHLGHAGARLRQHRVRVVLQRERRLDQRPTLVVELGVDLLTLGLHAQTNDRKTVTDTDTIIAHH